MQLSPMLRPFLLPLLLLPSVQAGLWGGSKSGAKLHGHEEGVHAEQALTGHDVKESDADVRQWSTDDTAAWLQTIGMGEYARIAHEAQLNGKKLLALSLEKLESDLLIASPEHRLVIEMELGELRLRRGLMSQKERRAHRLAHPAADEWRREDVQQFLAVVGLARHVSRFSDLDGLGFLSLGESQLRARLGLSASDAPHEADVLWEQLRMLRARSPHAATAKSEL